MMATANALREVERLARAIVDGLEIQLEGECDGVVHGTETCGARVELEEHCPKCGEIVKASLRCDELVEFDEDCNASIQLEADDLTQDRMRDLRLALVALDLARAAEDARLHPGDL